MFTKINSAATLGLECEPIIVETDISPTFQGFQIIGLPDMAIQEAKERIRTVWRNSGLQFPNGHRILVNLAPADVRKEGSAFDLPIAVGMFTAKEGLENNLSDCLFIGELALDGSLRHTTGILPLAIHAKDRGYKKIFVPAVNAREASIIKEIEVYPVKTFQQMIAHLLKNELIIKQEPQPLTDLFVIREIEMDMETGKVTLL